MSCFIDSLYQLLVAEGTVVTNGLLSAAISTYHRDSFQFFVNNYRVNYVAVIATETSTAAAVSVPTERKLYMFAGSFSRELGLGPNLRYFKCRVKEFETHVAQLNGTEAVMTICSYSFSWQVDLSF